MRTRASSPIFWAGDTGGEVSSLTIGELEAGLCQLDRDDIDPVAFWQANCAAFRATVLAAMRETSEALQAPQLPCAWRAELEGQAKALLSYLEYADRHEVRVTNPRIRLPSA